MPQASAVTWVISICSMLSFLLTLKWPGLLLLLTSDGGIVFVPGLWINVCLQLFLVDKLNPVARLGSKCFERIPGITSSNCFSTVPRPSFCIFLRPGCNNVDPNRRATNCHHPSGASAPNTALNQPKVSSDMLTLIRSGFMYTVHTRSGLQIVLNPARNSSANTIWAIWERLERNSGCCFQSYLVHSGVSISQVWINLSSQPVDKLDSPNRRYPVSSSKSIGGVSGAAPEKVAHNWLSPFASWDGPVRQNVLPLLLSPIAAATFGQPFQTSL